MTMQGYFIDHGNFYGDEADKLLEDAKYAAEKSILDTVPTPVRLKVEDPNFGYAHVPEIPNLRALVADHIRRPYA